MLLDVTALPVAPAAPSVANASLNYVLDHIGAVTTAIGGLGTASYGIVDASKSIFGGVSTRGFADIAKVLSTLVPEVSSNGTARLVTPAQAAQESTEEPPPAPAISLSSILVTLRSNWINGMAHDDQVAVAKSLVKLAINREAAPRLAALTGVDPVVLASVFDKIGSGQPLNAPESDVFGRFDLVLTTLLDQGYQRADQKYRNTAKIAAGIVSVVLAVVGAYVLRPAGSAMAWQQYGRAVLIGLLATPLAPIAKDISSAIQAGASAVQSWRK